MNYTSSIGDGLNKEVALICSDKIHAFRLLLSQASILKQNKAVASVYIYDQPGIKLHIVTNDSVS